MKRLIHIFKNLENPRKTLGHKNLYFDTLVHDSYTLDLLKKRVGVNQIIMGLDDPYPVSYTHLTLPTSDLV